MKPWELINDFMTELHRFELSTHLLIKRQQQTSLSGNIWLANQVRCELNTVQWPANQSMPYKGVHELVETVFALKAECSSQIQSNQTIRSNCCFRIKTVTSTMESQTLFVILVITVIHTGTLITNTSITYVLHAMLHVVYNVRIFVKCKCELSIRFARLHFTGEEAGKWSPP